MDYIYFSSNRNFYAVPNKELSLQYAREAIAVCGRCNPTPFVLEQLNTAKQVIEEWEKQ